MSRVEFADRAVFIDRQKVQVISGAIHYFRVPRELWLDRLEKLKMCGLNCVETYMCWNLHEPQEGSFDFSGMLDFVSFIKTAQDLGLYVIVRPGPYICAEWDNGGFPYWLMLKDGIEFRRMNDVYLQCVKNYYDVILPKLAALQYDNGGPVIAVQVENEYGSYSSDRDYMKALRRMYLDHGITVPIFTSDGNGDHCICNGILDGSPMTLNGGSGLDSIVSNTLKYRPNDPPFCMEFWIGWFDNWNDGIHHTRSAQEVADETDDMLRAGGNLNYYMFHGGTNFGFTAGANGGQNQAYTPDTTSYDYDAPLSEAGDPTPKYFSIQNVIRKYHPDREFGTPQPSPKKSYGKISFTQTAPLFSSLDDVCSKKINSLSPVCMEKMGQSSGFIHYRTTISGPMRNLDIGLCGVRDRAQVFLDGKLIHTYYRNDENHIIKTMGIENTSARLDILVENLGRINYGQEIGYDFKGITRAVTLNGAAAINWEIWSLPMTDLSKIKWQPFDRNATKQPAFHRAELVIEEEPADTFIVVPGVHGCVFVNGFNLGRYFRKGSGEKTLYLPGCLLKRGVNEIIVFETENLHRSCSYIKTTDKHTL